MPFLVASRPEFLSVRLRVCPQWITVLPFMAPLAFVKETKMSRYNFFNFYNRLLYNAHQTINSFDG
jgi:hypothetical protein